MIFLRRVRHFFRHRRWAWGFDCPECRPRIEKAFELYGAWAKRNREMYDEIVKILRRVYPNAEPRSMRIPFKL